MQIKLLSCGSWRKLLSCGSWKKEQCQSFRSCPEVLGACSGSPSSGIGLQMKREKQSGDKIRCRCSKSQRHCQSPQLPHQILFQIPILLQTWAHEWQETLPSASASNASIGSASCQPSVSFSHSPTFTRAHGYARECVYTACRLPAPAHTGAEPWVYGRSVSDRPARTSCRSRSYSVRKSSSPCSGKRQRCRGILVPRGEVHGDTVHGDEDTRRWKQTQWLATHRAHLRYNIT